MIYKYVEFGALDIGLSAVGSLKRNHMLGTTVKSLPKLAHTYLKSSSAKKKELKADLDTKFERERLRNPALTRKEFMKAHKDAFVSGYREAGVKDVIDSAVGTIADNTRKQGYNQSKKEIRGLSKENERLKKQIAKLQARG